MSFKLLKMLCFSLQPNVLFIYHHNHHCCSALSIWRKNDFVLNLMSSRCIDFNTTSFWHHMPTWKTRCKLVVWSFWATQFVLLVVSIVFRYTRCRGNRGCNGCSRSSHHNDRTHCLASSASDTDNTTCHKYDKGKNSTEYSSKQLGIEWTAVVLAAATGASLYGRKTIPIFIGTLPGAQTRWNYHTDKRYNG